MQPPSEIPRTEPNAAPTLDFTSPHAPILAQEAVPPTRPLGLTIIMVLAILIGIAGVLTGVLGVAQLLLADWIASMFNFSAGDAAKMQQQMQQEIAAATGWSFVPHLLVTLVMLGVSSCFLTGGIGLLKDRNWARTLLARTLVVAIVMEIVRTALAIVVQFQTYPIMMRYMPQMGKADAAGQAVMTQIATIGVVIGLVSWAIWALIKIGLMIWAKLYLKRPVVDSYFASVNAAST